MKFLIIGKETFYSVKRLIEEINEENDEYVVTNAKGISFEFFGNEMFVKGREGLDLANFDYVIPRSVLHNYEYYLCLSKELPHKILNGSSYLLTGGSYGKIMAYILLANNQIPLVDSVVPSESGYFRHEFLEDFGFPVVIKSNEGHAGKNVHLVNNYQEFNTCIDKYHNSDIVIQRYFESKFDVRVMVIGGKVMGAMKRSSTSGDFRHNFTLGAEVASYEVDDNLKRIVLDTARVMSLDYCGVDVIVTNEGYKVLEVNYIADFKGFEKATDINIAKEIIAFAKKQVMTSKDQ